MKTNIELDEMRFLTIQFNKMLSSLEMIDHVIGNIQEGTLPVWNTRAADKFEEICQGLKADIGECRSDGVARKQMLDLALAQYANTESNVSERLRALSSNDIFVG